MSDKIFPRVWLTKQAVGRLRELTPKDKRDSCEWECAYAYPEDRSNIQFLTVLESNQTIREIKAEHSAILKERDEKLREVHRSFKAIMENNPDLTSGTQWAQKRNDAFVAIRMLEGLLASSNDDRGKK